VPNTCVRKLADEWIQVSDKDSLAMARRLCAEEGLLVGGSSGTAVHAAIEYALKHKLDERHRVVVILPDSVRNYITKQADDDWMIDQGFISNEQYLNKDSKLYGKNSSSLKLNELKVHDMKFTVAEAWKEFAEGANVIAVVDNDKVKGVLYEGKFLNAVEQKKLQQTEDVSRALVRQIALVNLETDLSIVQRFLDRHPFVIVEERNKDGKIEKLFSVSARDLFSLY